MEPTICLPEPVMLKLPRRIKFGVRITGKVVHFKIYEQEGNWTCFSSPAVVAEEEDSGLRLMPVMQATALVGTKALTFAIGCAALPDVCLDEFNAGVLVIWVRGSYREDDDAESFVVVPGLSIKDRSIVVADGIVTTLFSACGWVPAGGGLIVPQPWIQGQRRIFDTGPGRDDDLQ